MAINGIGGFGGFYGGFRAMDIPTVDVETVKKQDESRQAEQSANLLNQDVAVSAPAEENVKVQDTRSRIANLEDISLNFNAGEDYSYIGSDSDLENLDMQKAISDMRKDKILEDYQYFVGSAQDVQNTFANDDGKVFLKY